ncbi:hypothetical protein B8W98_01775 [Lentilactobacillus parakefiri]|uniref:Acyltransferase n=1 Tax=Lentilactobacillus parakefiri TaxID=152332 RepID=A0A269YNZ3_9LACO|nr:hypothetical protein B8W98_01775 [Lentilactobacillus parakefiri]
MWGDFLKTIQKINRVEVTSFWLLFLTSTSVYLFFNHILLPNIPLLRDNRTIHYLILFAMFMAGWYFTKVVTYLWGTKTKQSK